MKSITTIIQFATASQVQLLPELADAGFLIVVLVQHLCCRQVEAANGLAWVNFEVCRKLKS